MNFCLFNIALFNSPQISPESIVDVDFKKPKWTRICFATTILLEFVPIKRMIILKTSLRRDVPSQMKEQSVCLSGQLNAVHLIRIGMQMRT